MDPQTRLLSLSPRLRFLKTFCMWMIYLGLGCCIGVSNATVVDMVEQYNASYEAVTTSQLGKPIGVMIGCIFGTPITDLLRKRADLFLFIFGVLFGVTLAAIPWAPNLILVAGLFFVNGLCHTTLDICCVTIAMTMWKEKASAPIGFMYTCLAIGQTVSPLITAPFLSSPLHENDTISESESFHDYISNGYSPHFENDDTRNATMSETRMQIPFGIFGGWNVLVAFTFLIFYFTTIGYLTSTRSDRVPLKKILNPRSCTNGSLHYGIFAVASLFIGFFFLNGRDRGFGMFVFTVANKGIHVSKQTAAVILFSYNAVGTIARALCALISIYVPIQVLMVILVSGAVISQTVAVFFALNSVAMFWSLVCIMAVFITPTYPLFMAWADRYIEINGVVMGIVNIGAGCGGLSCMFLTSYAFQHFNSQAVIILALIYGAGLALVFLPFQIISHIRGTRDMSEESRYVRIQEPESQTINDSEDTSKYLVNDGFSNGTSNDQLLE